jgi:hypothetical protein
MMLANFGSALAFPKLAQRFGGNARLLAAMMGTTLVGMTWLSQVSPSAPYLTSVALPMILIGWGGGGSVPALTSLGIVGVRPADAGAASGLVNVAHQIGGSLGLAVLFVVSASAGATSLDPKAALAQRVTTALVGATVALALGLAMVLLVIARVGVPAARTRIQKARE